MRKDEEWIMRKTGNLIGAGIPAALAVMASHVLMSMPAQAGDIGPDVAVSRLGLASSGTSDDFVYYGEVGGILAFSAASTSCNVGDEPAEWIDTPGDARNPVIAQNIYRLHDGKFEQLGMSWLKHSFCAVNEFTCGSCQGTNCNTLGVGCADTYWATLNGSLNQIGPRYEINPQGQGPGGVHDDIYPAPSGPDPIRGRLQVHDSDIIDGAQYFYEIHYVTHDESLDRRWNNASWREINLSGLPSPSLSGVGVGQPSVNFEEPAIMAWADADPDVTIVPFEDVPGEGRFHLGYKVTDNGDGTWTYEYALHNMNSHRGAKSFTVPVPDGVDVSDMGFHDVDYHSGDGLGGATIDGTDWAVEVTGDGVTWSTPGEKTEPNGNGLRWGSLYNFRFTATSGPDSADINVGLWRPGTPDSVSVAAVGPAGPTVCAADIAGDDGVVGIADLLAMLGAWGTDGPGSDLAEPVDVVDIADLLELLSAWGPCP
jgi:hypothetical protein